jgi:5'-methylthioadenosine phosphorylase
MPTLGVIGGSGLYDIEPLTNVQQVHLDTPFGEPSAPITTGSIGQVEVAFIPRHGIGHHLTPTDVPYRANIFALRQLGVTHLISISAVGSLIERYPPLTLVCPDQIIDRTVFRDRSFFEHGMVAHVGLADPFCPAFGSHIIACAEGTGVTVEAGGTYVCVEGPQFSTRAESELYRSWGASIIGMTAMPEARLAREAELCYAQISMVTDFDVWHESEAPVTVETVIKNLHANSAAAKLVLVAVATAGLPERSACDCHSALEHAIVTNPASIPAATRERVALLMDKYHG